MLFASSGVFTRIDSYHFHPAPDVASHPEHSRNHLNNMVPIKSRLLAGITCAMFALIRPCICFAQQPPAETAPAPATEERAVVLPPFEVRTEQDTGYVAQNTLSGSRLNTSLQDTPAPISVFTKEFLQDIGATSIGDLLEYASNAERDVGIIGVGVANGNNLGEFDATFRVRGLPVPGGSGRSVDFFKYTIEIDTFNTERIEFSRGPNSILFGLGSAGGNFNVTSKKAELSRPRYEASLRAGSWDALRAHLDVNQPLIKGKLGLRLNLLEDSKNSWRPHEYRDASRLHLAARWQIARRTTLDVSHENGSLDQATQRPWTSADFSSVWIGAGQQIDPARGEPFPANAGITALTPANGYVVYDVGAGTVYDWRGLGTTAPLYAVNTLNPLLFDFSLVPRETVVGGKGVGSTVDYSTTSAFLSHEVFKGLFVELAATKQEIDYYVRDVQAGDIRVLFDPNAQLPAPGTANPNVGRPYVEGVFVTRDRFEDFEDYRATVSYELDLGRIFGRHQFAGLAERRKEHYRRTEANETIINQPAVPGTPENGANFLHRRFYVNLAGPVSEIAIPDYRDYPASGLVNLSTGQPIQTAFVPNQNNTDDRYELSTLMIAAQSRFWNDRLVTTLGYREDSLDAYLGTRVRGPVFGGFTTGHFVPVPATTPSVLKGATRSQGAVFHATGWLSLFYNRSSNFALPNPQITTFPNKPLPAPTGKSQDLGVKLNLLEGRIFTTITYYETEAKNDGAFFGMNNQNDINFIWQAFNTAGILAATGRDLAAETIVANGYSFDSQSKGWEFETVANLTKNWRLSLTFTDGKTTQSNLGLPVLDYMESHRAYFLEGDRGRLTANGALAANAIDASDGANNTVAERLRDVDARNVDVLINPSGTLRAGSPRQSLNLRTNYTFAESFLRGVSFGGGVRWRSEPIVGYTSSDPATRQVIEGDTNLVVDANVSYRRKSEIFGRKLDWSLQLNVNNLLDNDEVLLTNVNTDGLPRVYRFQSPREWFVTSTFAF